MKDNEFFITGHAEYDPYSLKSEYDRDIKAGMDMHIPINYYPDDDPTKEPIVRWRSVANLLFNNWLNYYVYQELHMILIHLNKILDVNKLDKERSVYFYVFKKDSYNFSLCLLIAI